jgi:hypothetical protein
MLLLPSHAADWPQLQKTPDRCASFLPFSSMRQCAAEVQECWRMTGIFLG